MQWISHTNLAMIDHAPLIERCIVQPPQTVMGSSSIQWSVSLKSFQVANFNMMIIPALKCMLFGANSVFYSETTCLWTNQRQRQKSYSQDTRKQLKKDVFSPDAITNILKRWAEELAMLPIGSSVRVLCLAVTNLKREYETYLLLKRIALKQCCNHRESSRRQLASSSLSKLR